MPERTGDCKSIERTRGIEKPTHYLTGALVRKSGPHYRRSTGHMRRRHRGPTQAVKSSLRDGRLDSGAGREQAISCYFTAGITERRYPPAALIKGAYRNSVAGYSRGRHVSGGRGRRSMAVEVSKVIALSVVSAGPSTVAQCRHHDLVLTSGVSHRGKNLSLIVRRPPNSC